MKQTRQLPIQTRRDAWLEVDLSALEHNVRTLQAMLPQGVSMMAILKADAYGHGASMVIPTLEGCGVSMLGVAAMDEAIQLREAGVELPILVIGAIPDWAIQVAAAYDIQLTVFAAHHLAALEKAYALTQKPVKVHIKVDTGMHRIGVWWEEALPFVTACTQAKGVVWEGIFSHLACAGDPETTALQQQRFNHILGHLPTLPPFVHLANSGGLVYHPEILTSPQYNMVRPGLALWGILPEPAFESNRDSDGDSKQAHRVLPLLQQVLGLKARIVHLQQVAPDEGISYNHTYHTPTQAGKKTVIATLPLGYADGIPRGLSNKLVGSLQGHSVQQVGRITMDQLMVDVSDVVAIGDVQVGDTVTLLGAGASSPSTIAKNRLTISDWAFCLNMSEYELLCGLRVRLPRVYVRS